MQHFNLHLKLCNKLKHYFRILKMIHSEEIRNNDRNGPEKSDADYRFREERINQICSEVYMKNYLQCCMNLP